MGSIIMRGAGVCSIHMHRVPYLNRKGIYNNVCMNITFQFNQAAR